MDISCDMHIYRVIYPYIMIYVHISCDIWIYHMIYVHMSYEVYIYRMICEISNFSGIFVQTAPHIAITPVAVASCVRFLHLGLSVRSYLHI